MSLMVERLEDRVVPTAYLGWKGTLVVQGTVGNDVVNVSQVGSDIKVTDNGTDYYFSAALVNKVAVYAGQGDDYVEISDNVFLRCELYGDLGDDYLKGGSGNDLISGGEGNDSMYGSAGGDYISGWLGTDFIDGGEGNDFAQDFNSEVTTIVSIETFIPY